MNSGSVIPTNDMDGTKGQHIYKTVVEAGGCSGQPDTLDCLRGLDYETFLNATNSVPAIVSYSAVDLSYLPRPDGKTLTQSPYVVAEAGKYSKVPIIIGDQEDEGTLFALLTSNISTIDDVVEYLDYFYFYNLSTDLTREFVSFYDDDETNGAPFGTGDQNRIYPQFKRVAAILGDLVFTLTRRAALQHLEKITPDLPTWSYLSSYDKGTPILGTTHASDLVQVVFV